MPPYIISTHSRPKAAGCRRPAKCPGRHDFNTQPPEGGWIAREQGNNPLHYFNTQPPEGGWFLAAHKCPMMFSFQHTAARRRLGRRACLEGFDKGISTHSRPKAAGAGQNLHRRTFGISTHSRPKAAGPSFRPVIRAMIISTHSRPKAAG